MFWHLLDIFVLNISIHVQLRRKIVATSGSSGCGISSAILQQLGYLLFANFCILHGGLAVYIP